jgi:RNA polymerase sigma-70 factor, ECF subfamily
VEPAAAAEEHALVERGRAGDREALECLYRLHAGRIEAYLAGSVGNRHDAEDLTSQTFSRMLERIDRHEDRSLPFSAWLFRIARNAAIDHFRSARREQLDGARRESGEVAPSAEEAAFRHLADRRVAELASRLSVDQRRVVAHRFLLGRSNAEAAFALGKSEGAVKALQHRALASLASCPEWRSRSASSGSPMRGRPRSSTP